MVYENTAPYCRSNWSICRGSWNQPPEDTEGWLHSETRRAKHYCRPLCKMSPWLDAPPSPLSLFDAYLISHGKPFLTGWGFYPDALVPLSPSMCHLSCVQCHLYWCIHLMNAGLHSCWGEGRNMPCFSDGKTKKDISGRSLPSLLAPAHGRATT